MRIRNGPKQMLSTSGGFELLQMVSEPDTRPCANKNVGYPKRMDLLLQMVLEPNTRWCASEDVGSSKRVECEIPHWLERGMKHIL